ncbi:MAG: amidase [Betaproteobacteria bacterium]|nr:amidase [Betaproteobacteria bacterium]
MFAEYAALDATALAALIARREVASVEVLQAALARLDAINPRIRAVVSDWRDSALEQARAFDALPPAAPERARPFAGVPLLLKDLGQDLRGRPSTWGSRARAEVLARDTSGVVARWQAAGLLPFGQTNLPEFALKAVTEPALFGPCRNPWDPQRTPGGSSGGAAAAVAAGIVPVAGASDGGGSIRIPAAYCGLFGLRPSRGRVSEGPEAEEFWDGASATHVLTRSVRDSAALLDAVLGATPGDPFTVAPPARAYALDARAAPPRLRIGFSVESPLGTEVHPEHVAAVLRTVELLRELGHAAEPAAPAIDGEQLAQSYLGIYYGHVAADLRQCRREFGASVRDFEPDTRALAAIGESLAAPAFVELRRRWNGFARALAAFHARHDLYLTPTTAQPAARIGELDPPAWQRAALRALLGLGLGGLLRHSGTVEQLARANLARTPFTQLANLTGTPAMSLPLHQGADGLPVGVQFIAPWGREDLLFQLGAQLEAARPWAQRLPVGAA